MVARQAKRPFRETARSATSRFQTNHSPSRTEKRIDSTLVEGADLKVLIILEGPGGTHTVHELSFTFTCGSRAVTRQGSGMSHKTRGTNRSRTGKESLQPYLGSQPDSRLNLPSRYRNPSTIASEPPDSALFRRVPVAIVASGNSEKSLPITSAKVFRHGPEQCSRRRGNRRR
jgi:hypothetical protein